MSDKPLVQQGLASELAELLLTIKPSTSSLAFLRGFWQTTVREWNGIDRLRIDKYYMLVRRYVNASFRLLLRAQWEPKLCQEYNDILTAPGGPLCPNDNRVPLSLAYHLSDIYLEELDKVLSPSTGSDGDELPPAPLDTLLSPFLGLAARTSSKDTYERVRSAFLNPLFEALITTHNDEPPSQKRRRLLESDLTSVVDRTRVSDSATDRPLGKPALRQALLKQLFNVASDPETRDSNRRKLYAFWKSYIEDDEDERPVDGS
ncbi:ribosomal RNA processing protein [Auriscalpium vulgare]|uniref:Ribosomal RNA processing protein n=1 Tax=Auriscalpium vulgare TaxID=40419 RepID=A0ACB8RZH9_9AGAM|nr:ribosomal RNA processing protein [Auriscalpium vulgare]